MRRLVSIALMLVSARTAAAENDVQPEGRELHHEPDRYIAAGGIRGKHAYEFNGVLLEGGVRIQRTPLFVRAMANTGNASLPDDPGRGTYVEARAGAELRTCTRTGMLCGSLGMDVGFHRTNYQHVDLSQKRGATDPLDETFESGVLVPRFTVDGGNRVRVRGVLELPNHYSDRGRTRGAALSISLGLGF
ncbi:MAG: hypothetical protein H0V17_19350 [Deltaproteobacteria bacterium]|nr:hypothetical protein [Deltaproteobacteria bacterium]